MRECVWWVEGDEGVLLLGAPLWLWKRYWGREKGVLLPDCKSGWPGLWIAWNCSETSRVACARSMVHARTWTKKVGFRDRLFTTRLLMLQKHWRPPKWFKLSVCENDTVQGRTVIPDVVALVEQCHTSCSSISQNYRVYYFLIEGSGRRVWPAQVDEMALVFLLKACEPICTNVSVAKSFLLF